MAVRFLTVDDHPVLVSGLVDLFARNEEVQVVAVAGSGAQAYEEVTILSTTTRRLGDKE
jgi:DNA-binding NarL/FixJ family response regulator